MAMSQPPLRSRPNLHLALTDLTGSPRQSAQSTPPPTSRFTTPYPTPGDTPFAKTAYSPYYSAGLIAPTLFETPESFTPRRKSRSCYRKYNGHHFKRLSASKPVWLLLMLLALALWWFNGGSEEINVVKLGASGLGKEYLLERRMHDHQFFPATNPKIHVGWQQNASSLAINMMQYVGRWTSTPNRLRKDGTFPGMFLRMIRQSCRSLRSICRRLF